jgi:hypothetical protein
LSFPSSPTNGQTIIANGITYSYSTSTNSWTRAASGTSLVATAVTSTNISGGTAGGIPYQAAPGSTDFIPIGGLNTVLISDGSTATWSSLSGISAGASTNADNIQVNTLTPGDRYFTLADVVNGSYVSLESTTINKFNASTGLTIGSTATFTLATQATSTTTGALKVTGGAGIGGNLYVGGEIVAQKLTIEYTTVTTTLVKTDDVIQTTNTTAASSTTTGAVIVTGGIGVGGNAIIGGAISAGTAAAGVPGEIRASNEITAYYSDRRLKENVQIIDNAVVRVLSLTGITYTPNALAESYGYDKTKKLAGLFADEVAAVLPEAVRPAPFDDDGTGGSKSGENYQTIQYEKLIPLLVEAIKEQQQQIIQLKEAINSLTSKE